MARFTQIARHSLKAWMLVYFAFFVVIAFANPTTAAKAREPATVSPVATSGGAPLLSIDTLSRRTDI